jgi:serine/threonine protein kinase
MSPENWQTIKHVLDEALKISPAARESFLAEACGGNTRIFSEVKEFLSFEEENDDFLEVTAISQVFRHHGFLQQSVGNYKLLREIASGGMGAVYEAERSDGEFCQKVAVKLIKNGFATETLRGRFYRERQILAQLQHPYIARLLDGGTIDDNLPFLVMELIEGLPVDDYCREKQLTLDERLKLFCKIAEAVAFAHQKLIVHRDLKPANILVTADGTPKLLDFGIAKLLEKNDDLTETNTQILTPQYASPEQIRGEMIGTSSDIYSLGVILYEILTQKSPYRIKSKNPLELASAITDTIPRLPSQNAEIVSIRNGLRGDLDSILLKALHKDLAHRYGSVEQFAADIERHLRGLPVTARPDSLDYRARKFVGRNKLAATISAVLLLSLSFGILATAWQAAIARRERERAEQRFNDVRLLANSFIFEVNEKIEESPIKARELLVRRAVEYLDKLAAEADEDETLQSELAAGYEKISNVQAEHFGSGIGDTAGALESSRKALKIRQKLAAEHPDESQFVFNLSTSYLKIADRLTTLGDIATALENYRLAVSTIEAGREKNSSDTDSKYQLARAFAKLGQGILRSGSISKALENYEKSVALSREVATADPSNLKVLHTLSVHQNYAGYAKLESGLPAEALVYYEEALKIEQQIYQKDQANLDFQRNLIAAELWIGIALRHLQRFDKSLGHLEKALGLQQKLYETDQSNIGDLNSLADCYLETGWTYSETGKVRESIPYFEKALSLYQKVAETDAGNLSALRQLAFTRIRLGDALSQSKNIPKAVEVYQKALGETEIINQKDKRNTEFRHDKAVCLLRLATVGVNVSSNLRQSLEILEKLVTESPEHRQRRVDLENVRNLLGKSS